jgi:hypothetical protein
VSVLLDMVEELDSVVVVPPAPPLACVVLAAGVLLVSVLVLLDVWAIARPTPPANAAAAASVVRLFLVAFISVLLVEAPQGQQPTAGKGGRKTPASAS